MSVRLPGPPPEDELRAIGIRDNEYHLVSTSELWWRVHRTRLLNLATDSTGAWPTRAGGTFALSTGPHSITQRWARRITAAFADVDGLRYNSRFAGQPCIALFTPAESAMPTRPALSLPLSHPGLAVRLGAAAQRLGYLVV